MAYTAGTGIVFKDFQLDLAYIQSSRDEFITPSNRTEKMKSLQRVLLSAIYRF